MQAIDVSAAVPAAPAATFAAVLLHLLLSTFLWMPSYYAKLWDNTDAVMMPLTSNSTAVDIFGMPKSGKPYIFSATELPELLGNRCCLHRQ